MAKVFVHNKLWNDPHYEGLLPDRHRYVSLARRRDAYLESKLKRLVTFDQRIPRPDKQQITVRVRNGVAWLTGHVTNPLSVEYIYRNAMSLDELEDVVNELQFH